MPGQTTTLGPLGKDATLSLLIQEVMDLKARVKNQEQDIQTLKAELAFKNNITSNIVDKLAAFRSEWDTTNLTLMQDFQNLNNKIMSMAKLQFVNTSNHIGVIRNTFARLVGGDDLNSGRVEILFQEQWVTVCDDHFDTNAAKVVCRMLGKPTEHALPYGEAYFGVGSGYTLFPTLNCSGTELDLIHCQHGQIYSSCDHSEDAGVRCL